MGIFTSSKCGAKHLENEDHFCVRKTENGFLLAVADGIGSHAFGGSVARWFCKQLEVVDAAEISLVTPLQTIHQNLLAEFVDFEEMLESGASVSAALIVGSTVHYSWAGDSPIFLLSNNTKSSRQISKNDSNSNGALTNYFVGNRAFQPNSKSLRLENGDHIVIASDGANLDERSALHLLNSPNCQQTVVDIVETATNSPGSDDATIVCYIHQ